MSQVATLNNVAFTIPDVGDEDWGQNVTDYLLAIPTSVLQLSANQTLTGNVSLANQKAVRLMELTANGTNYIGLSAPDAVTASVTLKLPDGAGSSGQVLSTDGAGVLSWINAAGGGVINTGVQGRLAIYATNGTTLDDVVTLTNTISVVIATHGQASAYTIPDSGAATANLVLSEGAATINGAKTLTGATVISNNSTAAFTISQANSFKVDSSNALVSIGTATMTFPLYVSKSAAGSNVTVAVENSESSNAASHALLYIVTGGASGGDPYLLFYNGITNIAVGMDNSDSDALCWTAASSLNGTNIMRLTTAGALTVAAGLTITTGGATISAGALTIAATSNQIVLGTTNTTTISATAPAASRVYTMPDVGGAASFVMTAGAQSIAGVKTFSDNASFSSYVGIGSVGVATHRLNVDHNQNDVTVISIYNQNAGTGAGGRLYFYNGTQDSWVELYGSGNTSTLDSVSLTGSMAIQGPSATGSMFLNARNGSIYLLTGSARRATLNSTAMTMTVPVYGTTGSNTAVSFAPGADADTGMYHESGANDLAFSVGGTIALVMNTGGIFAKLAIKNLEEGTNSAPAYSFQNQTNYGMYYVSSSLRFANAGTVKLSIEASAFQINNIDVLPFNAAGADIGSASLYWDEVNYKTLTDRGCVPWCDDGVEVLNADGKRIVVSDLDSLCQIQKHETRKTGTGLPRLDYGTFPTHAQRRVEDDFEKVERDANGEAWIMQNNPHTGELEKVHAEDGVEMTMMFGVFIGAFKEIKHGYLDIHAKRIQSIEERVEVLEKKVA